MRLSKLKQLAQLAHDCHACDLYQHATQTVFGQGPARASIMFVGEQPGDYEDKAGEPFVGPAGRVFDEALTIVDIDRRSTYVTNAVKHFKFEPRGKRRIHVRPNRGEVIACRPWLEQEIGVVKPKVIVLLGATAAQSIFGTKFRVTQERGKPLKSALAPDATFIATVHPSSLLRAPDAETRARELALFHDDLRAVKVVAR